jgi:hypothetical protein
MLNTFKGWFGEKATQLGTWLKLDSSKYKGFQNIIISTKNGTTQIDHVILSPFGIFVIETKNYNGWIFGSVNQKSWTQVLHGTKHSFQNPLHQNYLHTKTMSEHLKIDSSKIYSVVFFCGDAELKTNMPANVMTSGLSNYIKKFNNILFSDNELNHLEQQLLILKDNQVSTKDHVSALKERYSSIITCPKCGKLLIKRTIKKGPQEGTEFLGCSGFPSCRYTKQT